MGRSDWEGSAKGEIEEFGYEFEIHSSEDRLVVTLTCVSEQPLTPDEYAQLLIDFAKRLLVLQDIDETTKTHVN